MKLGVEANGIEARGQLTQQIRQLQLAISIGNRPKAVTGVVDILPTQNHLSMASAGFG